MSRLRLRHFLNLWTLGRYPNGSAQSEWSDDQKLAAIKAAGFDGFQTRAEPALLELAARHGLTYLGGCDEDAQNFPRRLAGFASIRPPLINVQLCNRPLS